VQLINVGVIEEVHVGGGVSDGVKVKVGGKVLNGVLIPCVPEIGGTFVKVGGMVSVGTPLVGTRDGVGDSARKPVGTAEPKIGIEIKNVRALAETMVSGSKGKI
jgi:hypothetical protein